MLLLKLHGLIGQLVELLLAGNLIAKIGQLPLVLERFFLVRQQGFFLRRKLTTPRGLLQNGELIFSLPEILTLFAYDVVYAGMLLERFKLGLKGEEFSLSFFLCLITSRSGVSFRLGDFWILIEFLYPLSGLSNLFLTERLNTLSLRKKLRFFDQFSICCDGFIEFPFSICPFLCFARSCVEVLVQNPLSFHSFSIQLLRFDLCLVVTLL